VNFLNQLLRGIAFIPALVNAIEAMFAGKTGNQKKDAAMTFLENALQTIDAVAAREIVDPEKFRDGISKIVDGTVQCLNASTWAKGAVESVVAQG
jgi:predicted alpha-1,6-mannanase (GH76 family)